MIINTKKIENGELDNKVVFICDIRHNGNPFEKFIRNIEPTEVMIMSNNTLPKNKRIYYSESHFVKLKKDKTPSKTVIGLFDNTGYRSYSGVALNVFDNMDECKKIYNNQKKKIAEDMEIEIENLTEKMKNFIKE